MFKNHHFLTIRVSSSDIRYSTFFLSACDLYSHEWFCTVTRVDSDDLFYSGCQVVIPAKRNTKPAPQMRLEGGAEERALGNIYFHKVINFQRHFNMQLRIGVVNHIQPGQGFAPANRHIQMCRYVQLCRQREGPNRPPPLPPREGKLLSPSRDKCDKSNAIFAAS